MNQIRNWHKQFKDRSGAASCYVYVLRKNNHHSITQTMMIPAHISPNSHNSVNDNRKECLQVIVMFWDKNEWSCAYNIPICLHGVDKEFALAKPMRGIVSPLRGDVADQRRECLEGPFRYRGSTNWMILMLCRYTEGTRRWILTLKFSSSSWNRFTYPLYALPQWRSSKLFSAIVILVTVIYTLFMLVHSMSKFKFLSSV